MNGDNTKVFIVQIEMLLIINVFILKLDHVEQGKHNSTHNALKLKKKQFYTQRFEIRKKQFYTQRFEI